MRIKNDNSLLVFGMLSLSTAVLLGRYVRPLPIVDFFEGLLYGISMTSNLLYFIRVRINAISDLSSFGPESCWIWAIQLIKSTEMTNDTNTICSFVIEPSAAKN